MHLSNLRGTTFIPGIIDSRNILSTVELGFIKAGESVREWLKLPFLVFNLYQQNQELKDKITCLEKEVRNLTEFRLENERLKKLLDYRAVNPYGYKLEVASVVSREPGNWFGTVTINKGLRDGINKDMVVIAPNGLVGRINWVTKDMAGVLLITDPRSGIGVLIQETRVPGVLEGIAGGMGTTRIILIPNDKQVQSGQMVITGVAGEKGKKQEFKASIFPKGIPVGIIKEVERDPAGLFKTAYTQPLVDFYQLEEVMVIVNGGI